MEMEQRKSYLSHRQNHDGFTEPENENKITTIYIGGGTPSQLSLANLEKILVQADNILRCSSEEITLEVNPEDVTAEFAAGLKNIGANRISMGAQTFDDSRLKFLNRRHTSHQVYHAVETICNAGIDNISIDLMFGFPGQSIDDWTNDIKIAQNLEVKHISAYGLMYEEGTRLYNMREKNIINEIDEEDSIRMYDKLVEMLTSTGYEHYEISNFAKNGFRSRHNSCYWHDIPYMGIGAAAHSYNKISRQWNISDINKYIENIEHGHVPMTIELIDDDTHFNDIITTALRTSDGINIDLLEKQYKEHILERSEKFISDGVVEIRGNIFKLTHKGIHISDMIMSDLMIV